jgi:hypothetical protein
MQSVRLHVTWSHGQKARRGSAAGRLITQNKHATAFIKQFANPRVRGNSKECRKLPAKKYLRPEKIRTPRHNLKNLIKRGMGVCMPELYPV